jgi:hypothetical protein
MATPFLELRLANGWPRRPHRDPALRFLDRSEQSENDRTMTAPPEV